MTTDTIQEVDGYEVPPGSDPVLLLSGLHAEEVEMIALKLWGRGSCLEMASEECWFCKGDPQRCLANCR